MEELPESPVPAGAQEATPSDASLPVVVVDPLVSGGLSDVIFDLAGSNGRSMGAGVVPRLVAGHVRQLTLQLAQTSAQLHQAQQDLGAKSKELGEANTELALAKQEVRHSKGLGNIQLLLNSVGLIFVGLGIELYKNNNDRLATIATALGALLVVAGFAMPLLDKLYE